MYCLRSLYKFIQILSKFTQKFKARSQDSLLFSCQTWCFAGSLIVILGYKRKVII
ncbi:hypothetical protein CDL12_03532 [Handroanthus impetiginosus]|uniref:Uncharacterized protein n=1 Tax=Handroanthus impetiginosus TaxID=429701 RepID=A0A2G9I1U9_9LAMI|nr:hypothetical protein CDL12_03532 [Handroanthus impetiginosus]